MPVTLKNKNSTLYAFLKGEIDHHTNVNNKRICKDGPVFEAREIEF